MQAVTQDFCCTVTSHTTSHCPQVWQLWLAVSFVTELWRNAVALLRCGILHTALGRCQ